MIKKEQCARMFSIGTKCLICGCEIFQANERYTLSFNKNLSVQVYDDKKELHSADGPTLKCVDICPKCWLINAGEEFTFEEDE